ncbi:MAG: hypothetical protein JWO30_56 [Fibrobacteres bacterium]|nr:hypothetical protein [Fibrobacterota bacterium]
MKLSRMEKKLQKSLAGAKPRNPTKAEKEEFQGAAVNTLRQIKRVDAFKSIRNELHLSQAGMAEALQVSKRTVESWEGRKREIPEPMLVLAELLRDVPAVRKRLLAA